MIKKNKYLFIYFKFLNVLTGDRNQIDTVMPKIRLVLYSKGLVASWRPMRESDNCTGHRFQKVAMFGLVPSHRTVILLIICLFFNSEGVDQLVRLWICSLEITSSSLTNLRATGSLYNR